MRAKTVLGFLVLLFCQNLAVAGSRSELFDERVVFIQSPSHPHIRYETTIFHPLSVRDPNAPVVILNHGTSDATRAERYRPLEIAAYFAGMGSPMIVPMRRGYANSTGEEFRVPNGCDLTKYYMTNAQDVKEFVAWIRQQRVYQGRKIIMIGQSTGGGTTMAYSSFPDNQVSAILNFHGGNRPKSATDCKWMARIDAFKKFAPTSSPVSLWIYTANDHSSNPPYIRALSQSFARSGGKARVAQLPPFKDDGHYLLIDPDGRPIWEPIVTQYLRDMNLIRRR